MIELKDLYTVVRLLRNHLYPTYQLYAVMDNSKLTPMEGLKLGALFAATGAAAENKKRAPYMGSG